MNVLEVKNVGPIKHAKVEFGDLTILVGPQASGKSVFLQMLKLVEDEGWIRQQLEGASAALNGDVNRLFDAYFGSGGAKYWTPRSTVICDSRKFDFSSSAPPSLESAEFVPAQRALAFTLEGWPRPFLEFPRGMPYVLKDYGRELQGYVQGIPRGTVTAPLGREEFERDIWTRVQKAILPGFAVNVDESSTYRRLVLTSADGKITLPMSMWSAGQREVVPLLMSLANYAVGNSPYVRACADWLLIEEPEMGLHPDGIMAIMSVLASLLAKDGPVSAQHGATKICVSSHSNTVLEVAWVIRLFQEEGISSEHLLDVFRLPRTKPLRAIAESVMRKRVTVYYFDRDRGIAKAISNLDPGSTDTDESGWGGLTGWSGHVGNVIARAMSIGARR